MTRSTSLTPRKFRLVAVIGATTVAVLGLSAPSSAKPKPPSACQAVVASLGSADGYGLQLYTWSVCGRRAGPAFG